MIWEYKDFAKQTKNLPNPHPNYEAVARQSPRERDLRRDQGLALCCWFCGQGLQSRILAFSQAPGWDTLEYCDRCGWWHIARYAELYYGEYDPARIHHNGCGVLKNLDLADTSIPIREVEQYLVAKYDDLLKIHPRTFENVVASVFQNLGYRVRVTNYSHDQGIDVFAFDGDNDRTIGIQVKRLRNKIEAEGIRAFAGALLLNDATRGIYITSSEYTQGAQRTAQAYDPRGLQIDLWDANRFYDALCIAQKPPYSGVEDPTAPFYAVCQNLDNFISKPSHKEDIEPYEQKLGMI